MRTREEGMERMGEAGFLHRADRREERWGVRRVLSYGVDKTLRRDLAVCFRRNCTISEGPRRSADLARILFLARVQYSASARRRYFPRRSTPDSIGCRTTAEIIRAGARVGRKGASVVLSLSLSLRAWTRAIARYLSATRTTRDAEVPDEGARIRGKNYVRDREYITLPCIEIS